MEEMVLFFLTAFAALWDMKYRKIPNAVVFSGMLVGLCFSVRKGIWLEHLAGLCILFSFSYLTISFLRHWIGMGDMKLWMMCEAFIGLRSSFAVFTLSQVLLLLYVLLKGKRKKVWHGFRSMVVHKVLPKGTEKVPLGPFFFLATGMYLILG